MVISDIKTTTSTRSYWLNVENQWTPKIGGNQSTFREIGPKIQPQRVKYQYFRRELALFRPSIAKS
jgi:hypothetical protein